MTNPIPAPYAGRYALSVFCVFGFETAIELRSSMAAIILTNFFDDKLRANCLPVGTSNGRDYNNVTNPLASGLLTSATVFRAPLMVSTVLNDPNFGGVLVRQASVRPWSLNIGFPQIQ